MQKRTATGLLGLAVVIGMMAGTSKYIKTGTAAETIKPLTTVEHSRTAVKVLSNLQDAGGSGVILNSTNIGTNILTNKHVCELVQAGGWVQYGVKQYKIQTYKIYPAHDLCIIGIGENLGINTVIASKAPDLFSDCRVSGHPALLPMILAPGHFSEEMDVKLIIDTKPCTGKEKGRDQAYCRYIGEKPVFRIYHAQVLSSLIMPGSSGSGVFNKAGEVSGVVFAGSSGLSYADIVPWKFVKDFIENADSIPWNYPDPDAEPKKFMKLLIKTMSLCDRQRIDGICRRPDWPSIWVRKK